MIRFIRKPGESFQPLPVIEVEYGDDQDATKVAGSFIGSDVMSKKSFVPSKPILVPLPDENLVSYGDRMLWHQLGLQMNGRYADMLSEDEYVAAVRGFYPEALEHNVRSYRNYFNSRQPTMGFREMEMPVSVEFANGPGK
jgi:hypothetical protein